MKKLLLATIILFSITGCWDKDTKSYHFEWATIDSRLIQSELLKIAKKQNPYPSDIDIDISQHRKDSRNLSSQISSLTRAAKKKCSPKKQKSRAKISPRSSYTSSYNYECVNKINSDPLISDLKAKKEELGMITKLRTKHDRKVREASVKHAYILISQFSKNKFEIVINSNKRNILYNEKGLTIDITDAILNKVKENEPEIKIQINSNSGQAPVSSNKEEAKKVRVD